MKFRNFKSLSPHSTTTEGRSAKRESVTALVAVTTTAVDSPNYDGIDEYSDERRLRAAIATDNVAETAALMDKLELVSVEDATRQTRTQPLFHACETDARNVVRSLLSRVEAGMALTRLRDPVGQGLLHVVRSRECAKLLLEHVGDPALQRSWILNEGARINAGFTPLHAMVSAGRPQVLEYLLRFDVEFCCKPKQQQQQQLVPDHPSPIQLAASAGKYDCLQVMIKRLLSADGSEAVFCPRASCREAYSDRRGTAIEFWDDLLRVSAESGSWKCFDAVLKHRPAHLPIQSNSFVDIVKKLEDEDDERRIRKLLDQAINFYQHEGEIDTNKLVIDYGLLLAKKKNGSRRSASDLDESSVMWRLGCNRPSLLLHPLCYSFLCFKWMKLSLFFYINSFFYFSFLCSLTAFIIRESKHLKNDKNYYALLVMATLLAVREGYQLVSRKFRYFMSFEDWTEAAVVVLTFMNLELGGKPWFGAYQVHFRIVTLLLAWSEMAYMFARVPALGYYFLMYKSVVMNLLKSLLAFSPLLIGFTFGFDILFTAAGTHIYACDHFSWTQTMFIAARMFVMMAGELSYFESLKGLGLDLEAMADGSGEPGNSSSASFCLENGVSTTDEVRKNLLVFHVLFISFVLLVTIVMVNLLVGLAVSDITRLERKAVTSRAQLTASLIYEVEAVFHSSFCVWLPRVLQKITLVKPHLKRERSATIYLRKGKDSEGGFAEIDNTALGGMRIMFGKQKFKIVPNFEDLFRSPELVRSTVGMECWRDLKRIARKNAGLED